MPVATAAGGAVARSFVADASVKTAPMTEAPVISPRLRERLSRPEMHAPLVRRGARHDGGVVGRLEERVAGGDDDDRRDVAGDSQPGREQRQGRGAGRHRAETGERHA